jgi:hypothetical protein
MPIMIRVSTMSPNRCQLCLRSIHKGEGWGEGAPGYPSISVRARTPNLTNGIVAITVVAEWILAFAGMTVIAGKAGTHCANRVATSWQIYEMELWA